MKLDQFNLKLYIEYLLPGVVILISLLVLLPSPVSSLYNNVVITYFFKSEFIFVLSFLSVSYIFGTVSATVSRLFLNWIGRIIRQWSLPFWSRVTYDSLKTALFLQEKKADWNEAFRSSIQQALSSSSDIVVMETLRRREQSRLVRNLIIPLTLGTIALIHWFNINNQRITILTPICIFLLSVFLFAYAEYYLFAGAIFHLHLKREGRIKMLEYIKNRLWR